MSSLCSDLTNYLQYTNGTNWGGYLPGLTIILLYIPYIIAKKKHRKEIEETFVNAYALSMVDTYFYGYLRKILPDQGSKSPSSNGIVERIKLYKDIHGLSSKEFPSNKIFILLSDSGFIRPSIDKYDPQRIEQRRNLDPIETDRAGIKGRVYTSSVYKVMYRGGEKHISVVLEGAPPLVVLYESCAENPHLKKHKKRIITLFKDLLSAKMNEKEEFRDGYELIQFGDPKSLADMIIERAIECLC